MTHLIEAIHWLQTFVRAFELASVIAGETPTCSLEARIAVAHVYQVNDTWYGYAQPQALDWYAALYWERYPDPTNGATFMFGPGDLAKVSWAVEPTGWSVTCPGTSLTSYR